MNNNIENMTDILRTHLCVCIQGGERRENENASGFIDNTILNEL